MSTPTQKFLTFFALSLILNSLQARLEKTPTTPVRIKFFTIPKEEKDRAPLIFTHKKELSPKERKETNKAFVSITKTPLKKMTDAELRKSADLALSLSMFDDALRYLNRLIMQTKNTKVVKEVKLEIADINFDRGALKLSAEGYDEFLRLYPGDKYAEYAQYKGLLSNYYSILDADRDQTATHNTVRLAHAFLEKSSVYKQYNEDVKVILLSCYERLYDHEVVVFDYYMQKESFKAAETRLASLKKSYGPKLPHYEPKMLHLEYKLAQAQGKSDEAQKIHYKLASNFPSYSLKMALDTTQKPKKDYVAYL